MKTILCLSKTLMTNILEHRFLKKITKPMVLCFAMVASLALVVLFAGYAGVGAQRKPDICESRQEGAPCPLSGVPRQCRVGRCRDNVCTNEAAPVGGPCRDTDGTPCTIAGCTAAGICDQRNRLRPDGSACVDGTPGCSGQTCRGGRCVPPSGEANPSQVAAIVVRDVEVEASIESQRHVRQALAESDCCTVCEPQVLEAMVPTSRGPQRNEADGSLPLRRKFCGTITKYGVNDETKDPRDITINIRPAPVSPYPDFVAGLVNTAESPLRGTDKLKFGPPNNSFQFDLDACRRRADTEEIKVKKVIHAEVTPDEHFYGADGRFLPIEGNILRCGPVSDPRGQKCRNCLTGWDCKSELESSNGEGAEACVYGVYAYDHGSHSASAHRQFCQARDLNHDHPEIHPFDAIWWSHPDRKGWMFGVFQDDSNRYSFNHCGNSGNNNEWSQAPRDMTFHFPFKFPRGNTRQRACLRHVRTRNFPANVANTVRPLNVTTGEFVNSATEVRTLVIDGETVLEVVKEDETERETLVRVEGRIVGNDVVGQIILRVAVGCNARTGGNCGPGANSADSSPLTFDRLRRANRLVTYDKSDLGAGYYYAELTFECACPIR